ncbi:MULTISPECIES: LysR family transcriptional regulator [Alteromonadaceae]|uniref:LysR family transcriptional regulator n=1 Tax=Alteromonadaceae TaxID=72275 RepID=UPI001C0A451F|nr:MULTISPECIES: LysR family transcriptional regulator [Aliiglaciecola]MBU2876813.1 LysR family transcriptional regulator [Aliiglaciecola lipolytica]MDO6711916.1 LysR family transcriptional regulator [Aliiglaciecola sp. 2_MG-2023]MDO6753110.1 LysR family transcriptional regulator [Aliiglaciecola sp. 1_MG-2023]
MKNLSIDFLRSFVTIAQTGSYTMCAERLKRTQPAISLQIKKLEEVVGEKLFLREGNRLTLTLAGSKLLEFGMKILMLNDQAMAEFGKPQVSGNIKLGIPSEFSTTLMPKIIRRFTHTYPEVSLEVHCALSKDLVCEPLKSQFDLILSLQEQPDPDQEGFIITDQLVWVGSQRYVNKVPNKLPLIAAPAPCIYRKRATNVLGKCKKQWQIVYTISDLNGIQAAINEDLGITVLARSTVPPGLFVLPPQADLPDLGYIGVCLLNPQKVRSEAIELLAKDMVAQLAI